MKFIEFALITIASISVLSKFIHLTKQSKCHEFEIRNSVHRAVDKGHHYVAILDRILPSPCKMKLTNTVSFKLETGLNYEKMSR